MAAVPAGEGAARSSAARPGLPARTAPYATSAVATAGWGEA